MAEGQYCRVHIRVRAKTAIGQGVAVGGSSNRLGNYDKESVIHLVTTPDSYPVWYTEEPIVLPKYQVCSYKYCTVEGGNVRAFERVEHVRTLKPEDVDTYIEDTFNPLRLEGAGTDSEANLLSEMQRLNQRSSSMGSTGSLDGSLHGDQNSAPFKKLLIVCYHLPVMIRRIKGDISRPFSCEWAESLISKTEGSVSTEHDTWWIGTIKVPGQAPSATETTFLNGLLATMKCVVVDVDDKLQDLAYHGYCKQILWPIFHNVDQLDQIHSAWNIDNLDKGGRGGDKGALDIQMSEPQLGEAPRKRRQSRGSRSDITGMIDEQLDEQELKWTKNEGEYYEAYKEVTRIFDEKLSMLLEPNDIVWVHDYHLILLPSMIRQRDIPSLRITFFMHIPFPTSQIFRAVSSSRELLISMCDADIIGFHAFDHTRHFLNAVNRTLGYQSSTLQGGLITLQVMERDCIVTMSHVSIEPTVLDKALQHPDTLALAEVYRKKYRDKKIIVGIDACQRLSGGALKLAAFDKLLSDYSNSGDKVVLIQKNLRSSSRVGDEQTTSADMSRLVSDLNVRYNQGAPPLDESEDVAGKEVAAPDLNGNVVVDYEEVSEVSIHERIALYLVADVFLLTSIREGLNLMPLEYIYARKDLAHAGVVVSSEFSTCSNMLNGGLKVNPFYTLSVADALDKALNMSKKEAESRRLRDIKFISTHPSAQWTRTILADLRHLDAARIKKKQQVRQANVPDPLDLEYILDAYETSKDVGLTPRATRVLIFDYGGTLLHKEKFDIYLKHSLSAISGRKPTDAMMEAISVLAQDPLNVVVVMTGLTRLKLNDTFRGLKNVSLVTSNGLVYSWGDNLQSSDDMAAFKTVLAAAQKRKASGKKDQAAVQVPMVPVPPVSTGPNQQNPPFPFQAANASADSSLNTTFESDYGTDGTQVDEEERVWQHTDFGVDWQAVCAIAVPIISRYTFRTNGTCLSPRVPGVGWSYFGADPDWGEKQATQLRIDLEAALARFDVKVVSQIQGSIEIVPTLLNKGTMVKQLFDRVLAFRAGALPAFVLIIGDETSDDFMMDRFYDLIGSANNASGIKNLRGFTVNVGKREGTSASLYAQNVADVEHLLTSLVSAQEQDPAASSEERPMTLIVESAVDLDM